MPVPCLEGGFLFVTFLHPHPVVGHLDIQLSVYLGARQPVKGLTDQGQRVPVLLCQQVEPAVVDA